MTEPEPDYSVTGRWEYDPALDAAPTTAGRPPASVTYVSHFEVSTTEYNSVEVLDVATGNSVLIPAGIAEEVAAAIVAKRQELSGS